jgi:cyclophilin family peptidyl-prolyl cis-trans isomerase
VSRLTILILFLFLCTTQITGCGPSHTYSSPPEMMIDIEKQYTATIETKKGDIELELFAQDAPITVNNFVFLAREGFYNGTTFHRVIRGFMAQGGDPNADGTGGPGYTFEDEINQHKHDAGVISMANRGPDTNGSQFFITFSPQPELNGYFTVFGKVMDGMDVLQKLKTGDPSENPDFKGDTIIRITIQEN